MNKNKSLFWRGGILLIVIGVVFVWWFFSSEEPAKPVTFFVRYAGTGFTEHTITENRSVEEALKSAGYQVEPGARVFPERLSTITRGEIISVEPERTFLLKDQNREEELTKPAGTVQAALEQSGVTLEGADFVNPALESSLSDGMEIQVTRVTVTEETEETKITFKKVEEEDDSLSWQTKKIVQKGENGVRTTVYKVSRHNNTVVAKEELRKEVTKEPIEEKTVVGTKVTVLKKHTGAASWYAHTGTLSAANPWMPIGSYARVTNTGNGKSVIVRINDRGPFGAGRIIDLDKVAFSKIADLGAGVINVIMEEIK